MNPDWRFDQPRNAAVITLKSIVMGGAPILWVSHDEEDDGWQFLDGNTADIKNSAVVSIEEIVNRDPTLTEIADLPAGWYAWRDSNSSPWQRAQKAR